MEKRIIARGLLSGAIASLAAFVFARTFVEPVIDQAIAYEEAQEAGHEHGVELFTRGVQANIGMGFGVLAFGVGLVHAVDTFSCSRFPTWPIVA